MPSASLRMRSWVRRRPEKKRRPDADSQLPLPAPRQPAPTELRILPMQLQVGDHLVDATGEWDVVGHPYWRVRSRCWAAPGNNFLEATPKIAASGESATSS